MNYGPATIVNSYHRESDLQLCWCSWAGVKCRVFGSTNKRRVNDYTSSEYALSSMSAARIRYIGFPKLCLSNDELPWLRERLNSIVAGAKNRGLCHINFTVLCSSESNEAELMIEYADWSIENLTETMGQHRFKYLYFSTTWVKGGGCSVFCRHPTLLPVPFRCEVAGPVLFFPLGQPGFWIHSIVWLKPNGP